MEFSWPIFDTYGDVKDQFAWVMLQIPDFAFANERRGKRPLLTAEGAFNDLIEGVRRVQARMSRPEPIAKFDECLSQLEITKQLCLSGQDREARKKLRVVDEELFKQAYRLRRGPKVIHMKPPFLSKEEDPDVGDPDFEPKERR